MSTTEETLITLSVSLEPGLADSGLILTNLVSGLPQAYWEAASNGFSSALSCGPLAGYPMIDLRAILHKCVYTDGCVDDMPALFEAAGHRAIRMGLAETQACVVEPWVLMTIESPPERVGAVVGDLGRMRASLLKTTQDTPSCVFIEAEAPLAETFGYITKLRALTKGCGSYSVEFLRYAPTLLVVQERLALGLC